MSETEIKAIKNDSQQIKAKPSRNDGGATDKQQGNPPSLRSLRVEAEIYAISRTLEYTGWNRRRAAQLLSISYRGILYKIRQHNLSPRPRGQEEPVGEILKADSQS
ncbi:MAG: helix-turn-helix domain-containing protein [Candidatus Sulfotelmatobacter sp.]|jgi:DNA-binding NtrC family response regulator